MTIFLSPLRRVMIIALTATLGLLAAVVSSVSAPVAAEAASSIGGEITRSEVITRATDWYNRRGDADLGYNQGAYTWDAAHSRKYRRDCSGYVDMAWHLGADPNTGGLAGSTYTTAISRSALLPGDLLVDVTRHSNETSDHAVIFGGWENAAKTKYWYFSFGSTPLRKGTGASFSDATLAGHPTADYQSRRYKKIIDDIPDGNASIYGVLPSKQLTYSVVNAATGQRTHGAVTVATPLDFLPKAMAVINFNTILATTDTGGLYRIDILTNGTSLTYSAPVYLAGGWTHDQLAYDGYGHLYGIADGTLMQYTITANKPAAANITSRVVIDAGFTLKTLTTTGDDWLLGTTSSGRLISYHITGAGVWTHADLKTSTWQGFDTLLSPGGGIYFGHNPDGGLYRYHDQNPYDSVGTDLTGLGAVDEAGWSQVRLSVQPRTVN